MSGRTEQRFADRVNVVIENHVAEVCLDRPDKRNALDGAMFSGIAQAGEFVKTAPGVRAVVLYGNGASFCAGLDFSSFQAMAGGDGAGASNSNDEPVSALTENGLTHRGQQVAYVWEEVPVPVIAAVHGHALGGGIQIALGADIRIVHPATQMSVREVFWGLVPDMSGTLTLARLVREDVARELTYTARVFPGSEAAELGLATRLSEDPLAEARAMAAMIAGNSPDAVRGAKELFHRRVLADAKDQLALERTVIGRLIGSPNQVEAVMSGMAKRPGDYADPS
ncbi:MAG: crotonase/enoyl-CoA hydratase family protein [Ilumatobacteraceae bacterium]